MPPAGLPGREHGRQWRWPAVWTGPWHRDVAARPQACTLLQQLLASPIRLPKTPVEYRRAPPLVGEHTDEILADPTRLDSMRKASRERFLAEFQWEKILSEYETLLLKYQK